MAGGKHVASVALKYNPDQDIKAMREGKIFSNKILFRQLG